MFNLIYEIQFEEIAGTLDDAKIGVDGLFINADVGFDSLKLKKASKFNRSRVFTPILLAYPD